MQKIGGSLSGFARAQVAGNLSSALNQTAQLPTIIAENGLGNTLGALGDIMSGKTRRAGFAEESDFLTGKKGLDFIVNTPGQMVMTGLFKPAEFMDGLMATMAVRGAYRKALKDGVQHMEAMRMADRKGTEIMGSRAKGSRPLAFEAKNPVSQMLHIFQVEAMNSWEHIAKDLPHDFRVMEEEQGRGKAARALAGVIIKTLLAAFLLNRLAEELYGGTPVPFDILGLSANFIASGEGLSTNAWLRTVIDNGWEQLTGERLFGTDTLDPEREFGWDDAWQDLLYNVMNDVPYVRNAASLLGLGDQTLPMPGASGAFTDIFGALGKIGKTDDDGNSLFSGEELGWSIGKALAEFLPGGRQAIKTAQGIRTMLDGGRTYGYGDNERLQYPVESTAGNWLQALLFGNTGLNESRDFYAGDDSGLSVKQTQVLRDMVAEGSNGTQVYEAIQDIKSAGSKLTDKINALDSAALESEEKEYLLKAMLSESQYEKLAEMKKQKMGWEDFVEVYNAYSEIYNTEDWNATRQALEMAKWADEQGYTEKQKTLIKEQFVFFNMFPADAEKYEKLVDAGLGFQEAYETVMAQSGLEATGSNSTVSDYQKIEAIMSAGLTDSDAAAAIEGTFAQDNTYRKMVEAGVSAQSVAKIAKSINELKESAAEENENYTDLEKYSAAVNSGISEQEQLAALKVLMSDGFNKVAIAYNNNVTPQQYISVKEALRADWGEKSSYKQKEVEATLNKMLGVNNEQKAALWQIQSKTWKWYNNPFESGSGGVGKKVYDAQNSDDQDYSLLLPGAEGYDEGPTYELPKLTLPGVG